MMPRIRTQPGEVLREEFIKPLRLSANALALALRVPATQAPTVAALEHSLEDQLKRAATRAFHTSFLVAARLALLTLGPALALRDRYRA